MKTVKGILEELVFYHKDCVSGRNCSGKEWDKLISQALTEIEGLIPKEIEIPIDVCGVKVTIAEAYGWNAFRKQLLPNLFGERTER